MSPQPVRVSLPFHLRRLAGLSGEAHVAVDGDPTLGDVLMALEREHPELTGTVCMPGTRARRPYLRIFAGGRDLSLEDPDIALPDEVREGREPLEVVGAIAGG